MNRKLLVPVNGKRIRELRQTKGWSAQHLAEKIGLSASAIWDLERGRNRRTFHLEALARALKVDPLELRRSSYSRCIKKLNSVNRCTSSALPGSNYCAEHQPSNWVWEQPKYPGIGKEIGLRAKLKSLTTIENSDGEISIYISLDLVK